MPIIVTESGRKEREQKFIERAKSIHGDRFDYSKVYYINKNTKVCILLGNKELWQRPHTHLNFKGVNKGLEKRFQKKMTAANYAKYKKKLKAKNRKKYWFETEKKKPEYREKHKEREFKRQRSYKCIFCGEKYRKKTMQNYIGQFCSRKCSNAQRKEKRLEERLKLKYAIVLTEFRKKKKIVEQFVSKEDALNRMWEITEESKKVVLPQKYVFKYRKPVKLNNEVVLIERGEDLTIALKERNEVGKLINVKVETKTEHDSFIIIDKSPYHTEQMFNIMGNNNEVDITYILNNILLSDNEVKNIMIYKTNLIIKINDNIELIFSKHQEIIIDLYNFLQKYTKNNKIKYFMFMGMVDGSPFLMNYYDTKIKEKFEYVNRQESTTSN